MNQNAWWKIVLVVGVVAASALYAIPNLYPDEPAIQLSGARAALEITDAMAQQAEAALDQAGVPRKPFERVEKSVLIRIGSAEEQLRGQDVVQRALGNNVVVALNLAPTTPDWLSSVGAAPMKLGLDLRGGVHFKLEVDMEKAIALREDSWQDQIRSLLREKMPTGQRYRSIRGAAGGGIEVRFDTAEARDAGSSVLTAGLPDFLVKAEDVAGEYRLRLRLTEAAIREIENYAIEQNRTTIANRVNELGVAEPLVQRQGRNRIVVELPGVQDTATAKRVLGRTASLEFRMVSMENNGLLRPGDLPPPGTEVYPFKDNREPARVLQRSKIVTGDSVIGAKAGFDGQTSAPNVSITLDSKGGRAMQRVTSEHVGDLMAVLFVETRAVERKVVGPDGSVTKVLDKTEEKYLINAATIQGVFGSQFQITGLDSPVEAAELALLLRSGALAAPMYFVEERTIGPSLGKENIQAGLRAGLYGFAMVVLFMVLNYRLVGIFGSIALVGNLLLLLAVLGLFKATLTMPGIAGIVLTMGIAVDANVLINERIREELRKGMSVQQAIDGGYGRAWLTIFDSHITTIIVGMILFAFGSGSVKGFAITLVIGIGCSLYTAVVFSRLLMNWKYGNKPAKSISIQPLWVRS